MEELNAKSVEADVLIAAADRVVCSEVAGAGDLAVAEILNPGLIDFARGGRTLQWMPISAKVIRPIIRPGPVGADEQAVFGETHRFGHRARLDTLKGAGSEAIAFAIHQLSAGIGEDAVVDKEQVAIGQFNEVGLGDSLATEDGERAQPCPPLVMGKEE